MPAQRRKRTAGSERSANQTSVRSLASFGGVNTDEMKRAGAVLLEQRAITEVVVGKTRPPGRALPFCIRDIGAIRRELHFGAGFTAAFPRRRVRKVGFGAQRVPERIEP